MRLLESESNIAANRFTNSTIIVNPGNDLTNNLTNSTSKLKVLHGLNSGKFN